MKRERERSIGRGRDMKTDKEQEREIHIIIRYTYREIWSERERGKRKLNNF